MALTRIIFDADEGDIANLAREEHQELIDALSDIAWDHDYAIKRIDVVPLHRDE